MLSEISQTEEGNYLITSLICGIYKTKQKNKQNRTETDIDTENTVLTAGGEAGCGA